MFGEKGGARNVNRAVFSLSHLWERVGERVVGHGETSISSGLKISNLVRF